MTATPTGIVRWTLAAFHANPEASSDELVAMLVAAGVPHAGRAVVMLPLAYGRRILDGMVALPPTFHEAGVECAFADDALFAAADTIARAEATRADLERIGLLSSEVDAVNQALQAGSQAADLVLSPPVLTIEDPAVPTHPDPQTVLNELLRAHASVLTLEVRVFPRHLAPGRVQLQLDVVTHLGERELIESFGGLGATVQEASEDALNKFTVGSLHVLMATLDRKELGGDQVEWETWGEFDVCLGSLLRMWSSGGPEHVSPYLRQLEAALLAANLSPEPHWVRTYIATDGKEQLGRDMLLDNELFEPGDQVLRDWPWPEAESFYALRHFFMLVPTKRPPN